MFSNRNLYSSTFDCDFSDLFLSPPALFRGAPFWSWNTSLDVDHLLEQVEVLRTMGIGGFHMHSRTGMNSPYLGDEFMAAVKACVDKAEADDMVAWLYDEDRWPSGAAGGLVTQDPRFRARHLLFTPRPYEVDDQTTAINHSGAVSGRTGNGRLLAVYAVELVDGRLASHRRLDNGERTTRPGETLWYAYIESAVPSAWFNNQTYVDTLNPRAIEKFVEVTHERYREVVGDRFGSVIPGIFTDEPQFTHKTRMKFATSLEDVILPFTEDFAETYCEKYGEDLLDRLPELYWELANGEASRTRYRYHDHTADRFVEAFADTIGAWCEQHGVVSTGHLMEEPTLASQTNTVGDAMRSYRSFQLPGIDMLCDSREFTTAKQAQSASRQYARGGVLSELYGVTGWDFDFRGHKRQGDWQAALGVTVRVHHLSWVSMEGEAKRDYPASILHQSPWWRKYPVVEDHFARLNVALTRGAPRVRVGVVHPVESFWLCFGPQDQTSVECGSRDRAFKDITDWLISGLIDFDFINESLLPELSVPEDSSVLRVGAMTYDAVVVPSMRTIRGTTLDRLEMFADAGGRLVFAGEVPSLVDAEPSERAQRLAERTQTIDFTGIEILGVLEELREIDVLTASGHRAANLVHQMRIDGDGRYLFLCNHDRTRGQGMTRVRVKGDWRVMLLDTATGGTAGLRCERSGGWTQFKWECLPHGHLLLRLDPAEAATTKESESGVSLSGEDWAELKHLQGPVAITLSEPNALLLDQPEWRLNEGEWQPREEMLKLDDAVRDQLRIPRRDGQMAQPWTEPDDDTVLATLELRFAIDCEVAVPAPHLAIEEPDCIELNLDGVDVPVRDCGRWVDDSIRKLALPDLVAGRHELIVRIAYRRKSNVEWCYLLGDFGVRHAGRDVVVTAPVRQLAFGDWTRQGLPFYTGNLTYHCEFDIADFAKLKLRTPHFSGAMFDVVLDGGAVRDVAYAPFEADLGDVAAGRHRLDITVYGNRHNAFGPLHWAVPGEWIGPSAWRTTGDEWCYEYDVRAMGITSAPRLLALNVR